MLRCTSWYTVSDNSGNLVDYFKGLRELNEKKKVEKLEVKLSDQIQLILPSILYVEPKYSFGTWIEEGKLCFPEQFALPDELRFPLEKDVKGKRNAAKSNKLKLVDRKVLVFEFGDVIPEVKLPDIKKFCLQTVYGYWVPKGVINWYEKNNIALSEKIGKYAGQIEKKRNELINEFFEEIETFAKNIADDIVPSESKNTEDKCKALEEYFERDALERKEDTCTLKEEHFREELEKQVNKHIKACKSLQEDLQNNLQKLLGIHELPSIRFYKKQWDSLIESCIKPIKEELEKSSDNTSDNKLCNTIRSKVIRYSKKIKAHNHHSQQSLPLPDANKDDLWERTFHLEFRLVKQQIENDLINKLDKYLEVSSPSQEKMDL